MPGATIPKDPKVTVKTNSENCYLFVKVEESDNNLGTGKIINWTIKEGWTPVDGHSDYWYREVNKNDSADQVFYVLSGGTNGAVTVNQKVEKGLTATPKLTITAAAIQSEYTGTAAEAFTKLPSAFTGITP